MSKAHSKMSGKEQTILVTTNVGTSTLFAPRIFFFLPLSEIQFLPKFLVSTPIM